MILYPSLARPFSLVWFQLSFYFLIHLHLLKNAKHDVESS